MPSDGEAVPPVGATQVAIEHALSGILVLAVLRELGEASDFEVLYANPAACLMLGRRPTELPGERLGRLAGGSAELMAVLKRCVQTGHPGTATIAAGAGEDALTLQVAAAPEGTDGLVVSFLDVSDAEAARREMAHFFGLSRDLLLVFDAGGRIRRASRGVCETVGLAEDELIGRPLDEFMHPGDVERSWGERRAALEQQTTRVYTNRYRRADGSWARIEWHVYGSPEGLVFAAGRDVTERDRMERELRVSEARLRTALESSRQGLWDWTPPTGDCHYSESWEAMLGYPPGSLEPHESTFFRLVHPEDLAGVRQAIEPVRRGELATFDFEARLRAADGTHRWVLSRGRIIERGPDGAPLRVIGVQTDIDHLKHVQAQLLDAKASAESADRAKSEFLASVSHEIRTPMTAILGYADLLASGVRNPDEQRLWSETIRRTGNDLMAIIGDVLELSRAEAGAVQIVPERVSPAELVAEVCARVRPRAEGKGLRVITEYITPIPESVETDPVRFRQILSNLVVNAVRSTERGSVRVIASTVTPRSGARPALLRVDVHDTGAGIDPERAERLFRPYESHGPSGTGLGLVIARRLARLLGGDVSLVSSEPGRGSHFRMEVAVEGAGAELGAGEAEQAARRADAREAAPPPDRLPVRVLVADDTPDTRMLLETALRRQGAEVRSVADGEAACEAVDRAAAEGRPYDLILMDMQMPRLDGYEATRRLREEGRHLPIIALTAHALPEDRRRCLEAGCNDYLSKPLNLDTLARTIARWTETSRAGV